MKVAPALGAMSNGSTRTRDLNEIYPV